MPRSVVLALSAIGLWSTLAVLAAEVRHVPAFLTAGIALLLGGLLGVRRVRLRGLSWRLLALGVYGLFAYHFLLFMAFRLAPAVEANLLNYLWPLLMVVLSPVFVRGTSLRLLHGVAAALGFAGAALLVTGGKLRFPSEGLLGYASAIGAAVVWSTYSLMTRRFAPFPTSAVATFCLVSGALSLGCHALFEPRYTLRWTDAAPLLAIGVGPLGAAFFLWDRAVKDGDPRLIGTLAFLTPLLSTLWLTVFGQGELTWISFTAMALIIAAAVLGAHATTPRARATGDATEPSL